MKPKTLELLSPIWRRKMAKKDIYKNWKTLKNCKVVYAKFWQPLEKLNDKKQNNIRP